MSWFENVPLVGDWAAARGEENRARKQAQERDAMIARLYGGLDVPLERLGPSAMQNVNPDADAVSAQQAALQYMMNLGAKGGLDDVDKARMQQIRMQQLQDARGQQQSLEQRHLGGGGASGDLLAASAIANSNAANTASMVGTQVAADAQMRALEAMRSGAALGGQIRGQGFQEGAAKAAATDAINQFNQQAVGQQFDRRLGLANAHMGAKTGDWNMDNEAAERLNRQKAANRAAIAGLVEAGVTYGVGGSGGGGYTGGSSGFGGR